MKNDPIGVFDSGLGGISVLKNLRKLMPNESYIYFGDSRNAPYGEKSADEIMRLSAHAFYVLSSFDVKAVVIACNTATSVAAERIRHEHPDIPIIGMEPALKPAVEFRENSSILVMATPVTLTQGKFGSLYERYHDKASIVTLPCPRLVTFVEQGITDGSEVDAYLAELLAPYADTHFDSVVLGCTHYPFVADAIRRAFSYEIQIFDGGAGTARECRRRLDEAGLLGGTGARVQLINSRDDDATSMTAIRLFTK